MMDLIKKFWWLFFIGLLLIIWIYSLNSVQNSNREEFLYLYQITKDIITLIFIFIATIIAQEGLHTWKIEQIAKDKREITIKLLSELRMLIGNINVIRNKDFIFEQEERLAIKKLDLQEKGKELTQGNKYAAVLTSRWNELKDIFEKIHNNRIMAELIFSEEIDFDELFSSFEMVIKKIGMAFQMLVSFHSDTRIQKFPVEGIENYEEIVFSSKNINKNGEDLIKKEMEDSFKIINIKLNPYIKQI